VLLVNGKDIINPAGTNALTIYTAAEISFDTEVGKTYQLQSVSALSAGYEWQTIGTNIIGTGSVVSYVTPTRNNVQQYFRVIHN
jgi:hypothetical protein